MSGGALLTASESERLSRVREAAARLRTTTAASRNGVLLTAAKWLTERQNLLLAANADDVAALEPAATPAFRDRLTLTPSRLAAAAESLRQIAALADPLDEEVERRRLSNGLVLRRVRSPLGVILMIFESRPNVALESFSLALKSGNAILLRGGKESMRSTAAIYTLLSEALEAHGLPRDTFWGITDPARRLTEALLKERSRIDVVVPRGGDSLIEFVVTHSHIPIIKNDRGMCHVYVHAGADLDAATAIVMNAKIQRPGVCNAMETVLVDAAIEARFLPKLYDALAPKGVQWFGCPRTVQRLSGRAGVSPAGAQSWDTEYLDLKMNCRVVDGVDAAIAHIERHGSRHSEAIVTRDEAVARRFQGEVDAAAVYWNASTRFTDGFEFGLGGELGISTQKLHVRGPVGLKELTSVRWIIDGNGHVRS